MLLFCADPGRCGPAPTHEFPWRCHIQRMRRATARTDGILRHAVGTGRETSARAAIFAPGWGAETAPAVPAPAPCESRGSPVAEPVSMSRFRNSILASLRGLDTMWARTPHRTRRSAASSTRAAGGMKFMVSPHTQYLPCLLRVIEGFMKDVLSLPRGGHGSVLTELKRLRKKSSRRPLSRRHLAGSQGSERSCRLEAGATSPRCRLFPQPLKSRPSRNRRESRVRVVCQDTPSILPNCRPRALSPPIRT